MRDYTIAIDASVDIEQHYIDENGIVIIPMKYILDEKEYIMQNRLTEEAIKAFYDAMRAGSLTHTSQITPFFYEEVFRKEAEKGKDILYISLSSGLSNTYSSALTAAEEIMDEYEGMQIEVVDSLAGTGGMGLILMEAIRAKQQGVSLKENAQALRAVAPKVCHWFVVDDLIYLRRGGRISAATAIAGSVLHIKPILKIQDDGTLTTIAKQRGMAKASSYLSDCYAHAVDRTLPPDVIIANADSPEGAEKLKEQVLKANPEAKVQICSLSPVIGAHTGPGMMAVIHFGNRNYR